MKNYLSIKKKGVAPHNPFFNKVRHIILQSHQIEHFLEEHQSLQPYVL